MRAGRPKLFGRGRGFPFATEELETPWESRVVLEGGLPLSTSARYLAVVLLPIVLTACAGGETSGGMSFTSDRGVGDQPYPNNYRAEILAFMHTYLNNPVGVRDAMMAEPVQRTVGGRIRYVSCLRFSSRDFDGSYGGAAERAVVYVDGRLDRIIEKGAELCTGVTYAPFPELQGMSR
jgi:hypothetical protein